MVNDMSGLLRLLDYMCIIHEFDHDFDQEYDCLHSNWSQIIMSFVFLR